MYYPSAIFLDCLGEPGCRIAISGPKLKNGPGVDHTRQLVTIITADWTEDGKVFFLCDLFHFLQFSLARRDQGSKIVLRGLVINFAHGFSLFELIKISLTMGSVFSTHRAYIFPDGCNPSDAINVASLIASREIEVTST